MVNQALESEPLAESISGESQPQQRQSGLRLRRTRKRPSPNIDSSTSHRKAISHNRPSPSIKSEASGPHQRASRKKRPPKMPASDVSSIMSPKYTKTGRISKAKKGVKGAHICGCGKVYSRAEHLRRHRQNHETQLPCPYGSCGKNFHRQDLLERHLATKHNQQLTGTPLRRDSDASGSSFSDSAARSVQSAAGPVQHPIVTSASPDSISHSYAPLTIPQASHFGAPASNDTLSSPARLDATNDKAGLNSRTMYPTWPGQLEPTTVESHHALGVGSHSPYSSSGGQSPLFPYSFSPQWLTGMEPMYTQQTSFESLCPPYNSTNLSSPRSTAAVAHSGAWEMDLTNFPTSIASSPASTCGATPPIVIPQGQNGVPYPLPFIGHRDKYGSLDIEGLLEDQHLGICLSLRTKQHYVEEYWKHFHPLFPVLHKVHYRSQTPSPLLSAAVMAIGAQYTDEQFAKSDSRILHEKCIELITKYKNALRTTNRLDYMQAIFLVEFFSHFKAKRAASQLSEIFRETYDRLWLRHTNMGRSQLERLATVVPHAGEEAIKQQWSEWVEFHSFERLLTGCYILESHQALLLARPNTTAATLGLDLYIPASVALWEASNFSRWSQLVRSAPMPTIDVCLTLDNIANHDNHVSQYEPFQCALLTACHASSVASQRQEMENSPYPSAPASHPIFEKENITVLERYLGQHKNVLIMHHTVRLASHTPLRALLAASGESWVFSQRLSSEALLAAAAFDTLKTGLRAWTENIHPQAIYPSPTVPTNEAHEALRQAISILKLCLDTEAHSLAFGAEIALYYASLVLWAVTFTGVGKAEIAGLKFEEDDTAEFEAPRAQNNARCFAGVAETDINSPTFDGFPSIERANAWRFGVGAVLRWSAWVVGGAGMRSSGVGELMEGAVGVLERLGRRGWVGDWF